MMEMRYLLNWTYRFSDFELKLYIEINLIPFSLIKTLHILITRWKYPIEMIANKKSAEMDFNLNSNRQKQNKNNEKY